MSIACVKTYPLSNGHGWIGTGAVHWVPEVLPPLSGSALDSLWSCIGPPSGAGLAPLWNCSGTSMPELLRTPSRSALELTLGQHCPPPETVLALPLEQHWTPSETALPPPLWSSTRPPLKLHWSPSLEQHWKGANSGLTTSEYEG